MPAQYTEISYKEMHEYLTDMQFVQDPPEPGQIEISYTFKDKTKPILIQVFTSIAYGEARDVGEDAIRVVVKDKDDDRIIYKARRVHRVKFWRDNLKARLREAYKAIGKPCNKCGAPTVLRTNSYTKQQFYGCSMYSKTNCTGTQIDTAKPAKFNPRGAEIHYSMNDNNSNDKVYVLGDWNKILEKIDEIEKYAVVTRIDRVLE